MYFTSVLAADCMPTSPQYVPTEEEQYVGSVGIIEDIPVFEDPGLCSVDSQPSQYVNLPSQGQEWIHL